jgi:hypothetical protein
VHRRQNAVVGATQTNALDSASCQPPAASYSDQEVLNGRL